MMRTTLAIAFVAASLSGCATPALTVLTQTELSVTYCAENGVQPPPAQLAEAHCAAVGMKPKEMVNGRQCTIPLARIGYQYSFECVKP